MTTRRSNGSLERAVMEIDGLSILDKAARTKFIAERDFVRRNSLKGIHDRQKGVGGRLVVVDRIGKRLCFAMLSQGSNIHSVSDLIKLMDQ